MEASICLLIPDSGQGTASMGFISTINPLFSPAFDAAFDKLYTYLGQPYFLK